MRVTSTGRHAVDPPGDFPLDRGRLKLRQGAKADAVTITVDEALKPALRELAGEHAVPPKAPNGSDWKLSNLDDQLHKAGAYDDSVHGEIAAWLTVHRSLIGKKQGVVGYTFHRVGHSIGIWLYSFCSHGWYPRRRRPPGAASRGNSRRARRYIDRF